jgi:hypothetical protein
VNTPRPQSVRKARFRAIHPARDGQRDFTPACGAVIAPFAHCAALRYRLPTHGSSAFARICGDEDDVVNTSLGDKMRHLTLALLLTLLAGCSTQTDPAKHQVDAAQSAIDGAAPDASRFMPEHFKSLERRMKQLRADFDQKNYPVVLADGPRLTADAKNVQQQAATRKTEEEKQAASQWPQLSSAVPQMMDSIKARIAALHGSAHVPAGVNVQQAQADLSEASIFWDKAIAAHTAGDVTAAVESAKGAQGKAQAAADALKLKLTTNRT